MKIFGRLFKNKSIVTIVALFICLVILFVAYRYRVNTAINAINVPMAKETLTARTEITQDMIKSVKVAQSLISSNVITNEKDIIGKYVNYNTFIPSGGMFYTNAVVTWDHMPDSVWSNIKDGHTITSLPVDSESTYGNSIFPGDKIDLYYQNNMDGKMFLGPIVTGIEVLAVKDQNGAHIFKKSADQRMAKALIFAVPENYFSLLQRASVISGGSIIPISRNSTYNAETIIEENLIRDFIETNSREYILDNKPIDNININDNTKITE